MLLLNAHVLGDFILSIPFVPVSGIIVGQNVHEDGHQIDAVLLAIVSSNTKTFLHSDFKKFTNSTIFIQNYISTKRF